MVLTLCVNVVLCYSLSRNVEINTTNHTLSTGTQTYTYVGKITYDLNSSTIYITTDPILKEGFE